MSIARASFILISQVWVAMEGQEGGLQVLVQQMEVRAEAEKQEDQDHPLPPQAPTEKFSGSMPAHSTDSFRYRIYLMAPN